MKYRYLPMLRSKAGEAIALTNLSVSAKDRLLPVVHLVHNPPASFATVIGAAWTGRPLALDGAFNAYVSSSTTQFSQTLNTLRAAGVQVEPSIDVGAAGAYLAAVKSAVGKHQPGLVVKTKLGQLPSAHGWVTAQGWASGDVDLVISLGEIADLDPSLLAPVVATELSKSIAGAGIWRSVALSATSAPKDMGQLAAGQNLIPRHEWEVWQRVVGHLSWVDYSDYSTLNPELTDPPGYVMAKATISVRYTIDNDWLVLKGKATTGKSGQPMSAQYRAHAKTLVAHPSFGGLAGCWGDDRISQIAKGLLSPGNRSQWASYVASRHLSFIADRLP